jgi:hypothetical protein
MIEITRETTKRFASATVPATTIGQATMMRYYYRRWAKITITRIVFEEPLVNKA